MHVRKVLRLRTLAVKLLGALLAVGSGLAVGPEGPLVHAGAIVGSGLTTGGKRLKRLRHRARGGCCGCCAEGCAERCCGGNLLVCVWREAVQSLFHNGPGPPGAVKRPSRFP